MFPSRTPPLMPVLLRTQFWFRSFGTTYCRPAEYSSRYFIPKQCATILFYFSTGVSSASTITAPPHWEQVFMDLQSLESAVQGYFVSGITKGIRDIYATAQKAYLTFCELYNLPPTPLSEKQACLFAVYLANRGLCPQFITVYLAGVQNLMVASDGDSRSVSTPPKGSGLSWSMWWEVLEHWTQHWTQ